MIDSSLLGLAQRQLDTLLREQGAVTACLRPHAGRRAAIEVLGLPVLVEIGADGELRLLGWQRDTEADLQVTISADGLAGLPEGDLLRGARIVGAADFADDFSAALRLLRFDVADWLAPLTGDIVANRIGLGLAGFKSGAGEAARRIEDWLRQSGATGRFPAPSREQLLGFGSEARALFDAVEALDRRVARLEQSGELRL